MCYKQINLDPPLTSRCMIAVGTRITACHRVARSGCPLPAPTERSVPISGTTLVRRRLVLHSTAHAFICP
jgi:hypothetical protein